MTSSEHFSQDNLECLASADHVTEEFFSLYSQFADKLSAACFSSFFDALRADGVAIRAEVSLMEFKKRLVSGLKKELSKVWNGQCIAQNLAILKHLTDKYDNHSDPQWRPTGKGPSEQTKNYRIRILTKKMGYLRRQLAFQESQVKEILPEIENGRKLINGMASRRKNILYEVEKNRKEFEIFHRKMRKMNLEAIETLTK